MTAQQLEALSTHTAKIKAMGITHLSLVLGDALMTDTVSAALLGKADAAAVDATGASAAEVDSLSTLAAHIADGAISGTLPVTLAQLSNVRDALAPKLASGVTLTVSGTALADNIDLTALNHTASAAGGAGDDTYIVDSLTTITEASGEGVDTLHSSVSITLPSNVEVLSLTGSDNINGTGLGGDDTLYGNSGNNLLVGAEGNDILYGGVGNDTLDGGPGIDSMVGGVGDDMYVLDDIDDVVTENSAEGTDTVQTHLNYTLVANVEVLSLTGIGNINGTGTSGNDTLIGNIGDNRISGAAGNDILIGGAGNDTLDGGADTNTLSGGTGDDLYYLESASDTVVEDADAGIDTVASSASYTLSANVEVLSLTGIGSINGTGTLGNDTLIGNGGDNRIFGAAGNDVLNGGAGNDTLEGGTGTDTLSGGTGDDLYYVDSASDSVVENADAGIDTIVSSTSYTLSANVEALSLAGSANTTATGNGDANTLIGNSGQNSLTGAAGNDLLIGGAGNDTLDGGSGTDTLSGGMGNDLYYVDDLEDVIIENAGEGTDRVDINISNYTLAAGVEIGIVNSSVPFTLLGNSGDNTLYGGLGDTRLEGGDGNDSLSGNSSTGIDILIGGNGDDYLAGGAGYNTLSGGLGTDTYYLAGSGNTIVISKLDATSNVDFNTDTIIGFWPIDKLQLEIPGLTTGVLPTSSFTNDTGNDTFTGSATGSASPHVFLTNWNGTSYDQGTNYIWVDYDGNGIEAAVIVANIGTETATASQIYVF